MADLGAAFGFYPQLNRRRQGSPADSANLPVDVLRGRLAGLLGLPADMANLLRSPSPTEMFGDIGYEAPAQFPYTTEKFLKDLPLAPTSRVGEVAGKVASFVPLNPMPAVRGVQKIGQMAGEELAATMMGQRPNSMMSKVVPQPLFAVAPEGLLSTKAEPIESLLQVKPQAPVSDIGFYSATEQAALNLGRNKGTGQSFINDLMKAPDVKKEELAYTGLDDFLRDKPNVTKQEVQDFLANNRVDVQEVTYGAQIAENPVGIAKRKEVFDKYEPEIQALYKEMDNPRYKLVNKGMTGEEYNRGVVLQNRTFRGEPLTAQEKFELDDILSRLDSITVKEFDNVEEARKAYFGMNQEEKLKHSIRPVKSPSELQQEINTIQNIRDSEADAVYVVPESTPTKFGKYQLAGGENYREILLTLPSSKTSMEEFLNVAGKKYGGNTPRTQWSPEDNAMYEKLLQEERTPIKSEYRSSHFSEPNILAHMRVNDRIDADGKKMLLVEEIQSDWHQAGREKGYNDPKAQNQAQQQITALKEEHKRLGKLKEQAKTEEEKNAISQQRFDLMNQVQELAKTGQTGIPDAPFKDTWYQLALKRLTKYAADNGYERIGLTTGKRQIERFADELRQNVDEIAFSSGYPSKDITTISASQNGRPTFTGTVQNGKFIDGQARGKTVEEVLGKSMAKQIAEKESGVLKGDDLTIGGEGMKKYYDDIYPKFLDKYGKKYGASVGETKIKTDNVPYVDYVVKQGYFNDHTVFGVEPNGTATIINQNAQNMAEAQALANRYKEKNLGGGETIRYLDITPQMKEGTSKGQPLFAATPLLPATSLLDEEKRKEIQSLLE